MKTTKIEKARGKEYECLNCGCKDVKHGKVYYDESCLQYGAVEYEVLCYECDTLLDYHAYGHYESDVPEIR